MAAMPKTMYAKSGDVSIAYSTIGEGPIDLVIVPGFVSHLELSWEALPAIESADRRYATFARLMRFDKRGTGLSDRVTGVATLEERMDDVRAVMDAVGSQRAALLGVSEGGPMSILFAATYPERTAALVLSSSFARITQAPDYPHGLPIEAQQAFRQLVAEHWGDGSVISLFFPSVEGDERLLQGFARLERYSANPAAVESIIDMITEIDVRDVLSAVSVPTLVIHRAGDPVVSVELGRYLAGHIPGARYLEIQSMDHGPLVDADVDNDGYLDEIEEFLTGTRHGPAPNRVLATMLFTDIVASTQSAARLGDAAWRDLLERHDRAVRHHLDRFRGHEVKATGDGVLATFDGPARAIRCASAIRDGLRELSLDIRAGIHTGEVETRGDDIGGIAVHAAARIMAAATPGEVLASRTVKDLVAGSGIEFLERGIHTLKGLPDTWELFAVPG